MFDARFFIWATRKLRVSNQKTHFLFHVLLNECNLLERRKYIRVFASFPHAWVFCLKAFESERCKPTKETFPPCRALNSWRFFEELKPQKKYFSQTQRCKERRLQVLPNCRYSVVFKIKSFQHFYDYALQHQRLFKNLTKRWINEANEEIIPVVFKAVNITFN